MIISINPPSKPPITAPIGVSLLFLHKYKQLSYSYNAWVIHLFLKYLGMLSLVLLKWSKYVIVIIDVTVVVGVIDDIGVWKWDDSFCVTELLNTVDVADAIGIIDGIGACIQVLFSSTATELASQQPNNPGSSSSGGKLYILEDFYTLYNFQNEYQYILHS